MKRLTLMGLALAFGFGAVGCAMNTTAPFTPAQGVFFNNTTAPLSTEYPAAMQASGLRSGKVSATNILGLFAFGDCGIRAAAEAGQLRTVSFADYSNFNILGVYQRTTVTVYGN